MVSTRKKGTVAKRGPGKLAPREQGRGLEASEIAVGLDSAEVAGLAALIRDAGGAPIGAYRDPLAGRALVLASVQIKAILPTPFQRDLAPTHVKKLAAKIDETAAFLDPLIVVRGETGQLWTPNGRHRLQPPRCWGLDRSLCSCLRMIIWRTGLSRSHRESA